MSEPAPRTVLDVLADFLEGMAQNLRNVQGPASHLSVVPDAPAPAGEPGTTDSDAAHDAARLEAQSVSEALAQAEKEL